MRSTTRPGCAGGSHRPRHAGRFRHRAPCTLAPAPCPNPPSPASRHCSGSERSPSGLAWSCAKRRPRSARGRNSRSLRSAPRPRRRCPRPRHRRRPPGQPPAWCTTAPASDRPPRSAVRRAPAWSGLRAPPARHPSGAESRPTRAISPGRTAAPTTRRSPPKRCDRVFRQSASHDPLMKHADQRE